METLRVTGQDRGLSQVLERWRPARAVHDPGKIVADLAVSLALGGDCLAGIAALRSSPELFGLVASDPTVSRLVKSLAEAGPKAFGQSARHGSGRGSWRESTLQARTGA